MQALIVVRALNVDDLVKIISVKLGEGFYELHGEIFRETDIGSAINVEGRHVGACWSHLMKLTPEPVKKSAGIARRPC